MHRLGRIVTALACLFIVSGNNTRAEERFALVVGNAEYGIGALKNPINDGRAMAAVLTETGFQTTLLENVNSADFQKGVSAFLEKLPKDAISLFYYSGHAIQLDGRNYLLPVDADAGSRKSLLSKSMSANELIERFHDRGVGFSIVVLDACRSNPFLEDGSEVGRGLASMESESGETLIAFSTQAGEVAFDGTGPNSPYTGALVTEIDKQGRDILDVFKAVRRSVRIWTGGLQRPFISASIERRFEFRSLPSAASASVDMGQLTFETLHAVIEALWWNIISESHNPDDFRAFAAKFPHSLHVKEAQIAAAKVEEQDTAVRGIELAQFEVPEARRASGGLSQVITACDISAGDPDDPRRVTPGVAWGLVNVRVAMRACAQALAEDPRNPRLVHEMGRLLDIQGRYDEAEAFYRLAGSQDYSASLVNLGFMSVTAKGRERDYAAAMTLYRRAADLGNLRARTNIGEMYELGWSVDKNLDEAVLWYRLAAQNGWPNALDALANLYRKGPDEAGQGLERDPKEAVRLYRTASELGSSNAMNNLGQLYLSDELGAPDVAEGVRWLSVASERGNRFAPYNLGRLYREGNLVKRDYASAVKFFSASADLGFAPARIALGRMHQSGQGFPKSVEEAAFQYMIAAMTSDKKRLKEEEEAQQRLSDLGLPQRTLTRVKARAEEWVRLNGG